MTRISSSATLILALFIPVFWIVFFGLLFFFIMFSSLDDMLSESLLKLRLFYAIFFISFGLLIYFKLMTLRRVELDGDFVYVTNYLKTIRFPIENISELKMGSLFFFTMAKLKLHQKGSFGQTIRFITDERKLQLLRDKLFRA
ncbi:MAG: hypothetical protein M3Q56_06910 [Bacteroidota bacterium]|nr:hypothetical protein [Bacteroidota bacterium]